MAANNALRPSNLQTNITDTRLYIRGNEAGIHIVTSIRLVK